MKDFRTGVSYYTRSKVEISFPEDDVCWERSTSRTENTVRELVNIYHHLSTRLALNAL